MLEDVEIDSIALDRYYSYRSVLEIFGEKTSVYVIPRENTCNFGVEWMRVLKRIVEAPAEFLKSYFKRNLSESGFSSDKRRFGCLETDAPLVHPRFCCAKSISSRRKGMTEESRPSSAPRSCTTFSLSGES